MLTVLYYLKIDSSFSTKLLWESLEWFQRRELSMSMV